jgi:hypothetical protein
MVSEMRKGEIKYEALVFDPNWVKTGADDKSNIRKFNAD